MVENIIQIKSGITISVCKEDCAWNPTVCTCEW